MRLYILLKKRDFLRLFLSGFTPLEKATDFNRWLLPLKAGGDLKPEADPPQVEKPPSTQTVYPLRKRFSNRVKGGSSLTGFTLAEVLVVTIIASLIIAGLLAVLYVGDMSWRLDQGLLGLHQEARGAMDGMIREIRQSKSSDINITSGGSRVEFYIPASSYPIYYYLSNNQIIREHPQDTVKILANNINFLNFSLSGDIFYIQMQAAKTVRGKNLSFPLTEKVRLRND